MTWQTGPCEFYGEVCQYRDCGTSDKATCKYPRTSAAIQQEKEMEYYKEREKTTALDPRGEIGHYGQQNLRSPEKLGGASTRGASPFHGAVTQLEANIAGLDKVLGELHIRLVPLLREETAEDEVPPSITGTAPMTRALWEQARKVEKLTLAVGGVIKRLEV